MMHQTLVAARTLIAFVLLAALAGCSKPPRTARAPSGPALSVLSYNVNFGLAGDGPTLAAIADAGADVVFLQETTPAWERALRARFGRRYPHIAFRHSGGAGGLALLSRHRFEERSCPHRPAGFPPGVCSCTPRWARCRR